MIYNRCGCTPIGTVSTCPPTGGECCLKVCNVLADKELNPCNDSISLDITKYITIPNCCNKSTLQFRVKLHSDNITNVTPIYSNNEFLINITSNSNINKNWKFATLTYEVECGILKVRATVTIPFKQLVENPDCSNGYDPCTGLCIEPIIDLEITDNGNSNITIV